MKENISINKTKLYRLVKHYFENGELPPIGAIKYQHYNEHCGRLYFYSSNDTYYRASFGVMGKECMLGIYEVDPFKTEAGEKCFSKVYHPSVEILKNIGVYKEVQLKV